jgi:phosphoribosylformylglycinamidine synthase subunit PurQ / glutaminase
MHAAVIVFPGTNADAEMVRTLREVCGAKVTLVWHTETTLPTGTDLVALPGGFSYGDYLRSGALAKVSPVLGAIRDHAAKGGYVLGVCNGFQILTEVGLLPGALTRNAHLRFECSLVHVVVSAEGPFTPKTGDVWKLPIAHADGCYQATPEVLAVLEAEGRVALRYASRSGEVVPDANPNGSASAIAGIYGGPRKNVFGLMPHPERMSEAVHGGVDGRRLFDAVLGR